MKHTIVVVALIVGTSAEAQQYGRFLGQVVAEWNRDGRTMTLVQDFAYVDPSGVRWDAPRGSQVDGASIPPGAWSFIGGPFEGKYREASVIHDVACVNRARPWQEVHLVFYWAMLANGVAPSRAKIMYWAVDHFGPKWDPPGTVSGGGPTPPLSQAEFNRAVQIIQEREASGRPMSVQELQGLRFQ
jgi:hypothetical protein